MFVTRQRGNSHLIALAVRYGGRLVTFDAALVDSVPDGVAQLLQ